MKSDYQSGMKIGILGGGQLGRMFIQEALNLDIHVHILDPEQDAPCAPIAHHFVQGDIKDFDTVYNFGKDKDVVTIEIEHVNVDALEQLEKDGVQVYPQPRVIRLIQDKGSQKEFYEKENIPTAPFRLVAENADLQDHLDYLPYMQKARKGGYDGKGVQAIKSTDDFSKAFTTASVLESFIDFEKELSVIVARNKDGATTTYPIVELEFNPTANLVEFLFAPADVTNEIAETAQKIAIDIITKLDMVGLLAVELFLTKSGEVLVNEIAPRPHNSGHQTIEANYTSQYEQHLRSIINLPLGSTNAIQPSVMVNLLGEPNHTGKAKYEGIETVLAMEGVFPHLYGKTNTKPFRKMGHITITNATLNKAKEIAFKVKETLKVVSE
ncbi:5-(carboxyamino)imidazole ribonucleotide synthase [Crocinitomix algicola]|uniref:5-(carboxyamino)imidazole ribonucleotide synthase n=1 Tax=Crocinitomix algicola TaxID=1740263 RepID=UPI00082DB7ED|nr:5-(carboxyamino)imidazole ribonucleotide synthase [Crocinitomix algicola]